MPAASLNDPLRLNTARLRREQDTKDDGLRRILQETEDEKDDGFYHNDTKDFNTEEAKETKDEDVDGFLPPPRTTDYDGFTGGFGVKRRINLRDDDFHRLKRPGSRGPWGH